MAPAGAEDSSRPWAEVDANSVRTESARVGSRIDQPAANCKRRLDDRPHAVPLPCPGEARRGWDGRGLPGRGHAPETPGGAQGAAGGHGGGPRAAPEVPAGGGGRRLAESPGDRHPLLGGRGRQRALPDHGAGLGPEARRGRPARRNGARRLCRRGGAARRGAGGGPRAGDHPSGPQAGQRHGHRRRRGQGPRLRTGEARAAGQCLGGGGVAHRRAHAGGPGARHHPLHVSRAAPGPTGGSPLGRLLGRHRPPRDDHRRAPLQGRKLGLPHQRHSPRPTRVGDPTPRRRSALARAGDPALPGKGPGAALSDGKGPAQRARGAAGGRRRVLPRTGPPRLPCCRSRT